MKPRDTLMLGADIQRGFTLIELMIVVVIVGILAAIAVPSYQDYVQASKRSVAKSALLDLASRQEQFYLDNKTYTTDLTNFGYAAAGAYYVDDTGQVVAAASADRIYKIVATVGSATAYTLEATPEAGMSSDAGCTKFTLNSAGVKSATGATVDKCW